jgi:hypothetical protein
MNPKKIIIFPIIIFLILFTVGMLLSNVIQVENLKFTPPTIGPDNCSVWYDGCNTCTVVINPEGIEDFACTKMACSEYKTSECLEPIP